jgi:hypothetical protein
MKLYVSSLFAFKIFLCVVPLIGRKQLKEDI